MNNNRSREGLSALGKGLSALGKGLSALGKGLSALGKGLSALGKGLSALGKGLSARASTSGEGSERECAQSVSVSLTGMYSLDGH
jgi:uncharacterized phage infection (PIP) family protein YhgE